MLSPINTILYSQLSDSQKDQFLEYCEVFVIGIYFVLFIKRIFIKFNYDELYVL